MITCITGSWALATTVAMSAFASQIESNRTESVANRQVNVDQDISIAKIDTKLGHIIESLNEIKASLRGHEP
jgi:uncharacterized membrane protein